MVWERVVNKHQSRLQANLLQGQKIQIESHMLMLTEQQRCLSNQRIKFHLIIYISYWSSVKCKHFRRRCLKSFRSSCCRRTEIVQEWRRCFLETGVSSDTCLAPIGSVNGRLCSETRQTLELDKLWNLCVFQVSPHATRSDSDPRRMQSEEPVRKDAHCFWWTRKHNNNKMFSFMSFPVSKTFKCCKDLCLCCFL